MAGLASTILVFTFLFSIFTTLLSYQDSVQDASIMTSLVSNYITDNSCTLADVTNTSGFIEMNKHNYTITYRKTDTNWNKVQEVNAVSNSNSNAKVLVICNSNHNFQVVTSIDFKTGIFETKTVTRTAKGGWTDE